MIPNRFDLFAKQIVRDWLLSLTMSLAVLTSIFAQQKHPSFELDIVPLLTKHGCNSGACHGAVAGRGEFFLSLWGSDPKSDYKQIVQAFDSRRIRYNTPEESLLIAKPSGRIAHEGQVRFEPDSLTAETLARWIQAGTPYGDPADIDQLMISADRVLGTEQAFEYRLSTTAASSASGRFFDATDRTTWETDPNGGVIQTQANPPRIRLDRPGRHVITARFAGQVRSLVLIAPYPQDALGRKLAESIPSSTSEASIIDQQINGMLEQANLASTGLVDELTWLRRASLDLMGRIPSIKEIRDFEELDPAKRKAICVDRMIESESFNEYWTYKLARWLGLRPLPNDPDATKAFENYLRERVSSRDSWQKIARELLVSSGDSHRVGQVNFARMAADPRAHGELISRVFLGARLGCANCHNHPLDRWTQDDYHGLAAILAGIDRSRQVRYVGGAQVTNLRTKEPAIPKLPGGQYLSLQTDEKIAAENMEQLGRWLLDDKDSKFARVLANRLWATLMGRGLIDPIDDLRETNPASHPILLDLLSKMLVESDYQPSNILKAIVLSDAYSRVPVDTKRETIDASFFATHIDKPLAPEVLYDALNDAMGLTKETRAIRWLDPTLPNDSLDILGRCNRSMGCEESSTGGSIDSNLSMQLHWINGPLVNQAVESNESYLHRELDRGTTDEDLIELSFLRILTKHADSVDVQRWAKQVPSDPQLRKAWFEDWIWSLLSGRQFLCN